MRVPLAKKLVAFLYPTDNTQLLERAREDFTSRWGQIQRESAHLPFDWTDYYAGIAPSLTRCFFSFAGLRSVDALPRWKREAIELEAASGAPRRVNIDPGYVDGARLVLASTKDNAHRVYIEGGIFAEVTLCRRGGKWEPFFHTFPDFRSGIYDEFLDSVRMDWKEEMRNLKKGDDER